MHLPEVRVNVSKLKNYVLLRQNDNGGFAISKQLPSSLPETYYAVYILTAIRDEVPDKDKVVNFLRSRIRKETYTIYYTFSSLNALGEDIPDLSDFLLQKLDCALSRQTVGSIGGRGITATYSFEMPNVLREVYMLTSSLRLLGRESEDAKDFVRKFKRDGGFGIMKPDLQETYYCISVLHSSQNIKRDVVEFIKKHECSGGFSKLPGGYPPYLEETYYALSSFKLLNHRYSNSRTAEYIASLQNPDGGFRRSIHGGISSLEYTYYAVASLKYFEEE